MGKLSRTGANNKMSKLFCTDVSSETGKARLQKSVERLIKENQKVFDNLAKS